MTRLFAACSWLLWLALLAPAATPPPRGDIVARIALISDLHVQRSTNHELAQAHARFHQAIADINAARVDLVLAAGDLTEWAQAEDFARFRQHVRKFDAPVWYVPGNHDMGGKIIRGKTNAHTVTPWSLRFYESRMGPSFFSRTRAGVRVIGINSTILDSDMRREKAMWRMLEKELAQPSPLPTIVLTHYPVFYKTPDEGGGDYWNVEPAPRGRLLPLLQEGSVKLVLSGHIHTQRVNRHEGILYVTTPPISFGLPNGKQPEGWMLITIPREGEAQVEFRRVDLGAK